MGKLATTGRLVTRRNEEKRKKAEANRGWVDDGVAGRRRGRWLTGSNNELSVLFGVATIVTVATALCVPVVTAVPTLFPEDPRLSRTGLHRVDLDRSAGLEDVYEDALDNALDNALEDSFPEEFRRPAMSTVLDETELNIIRRSIARGLGLERIPDPSKANVSQAEYERAHNEYLMKVQLSPFDRQTVGRTKLHVFPATAYPGNESSHRPTDRPERDRGRYRHRLFFRIRIPTEDADRMSSTVDHATLRLLLHGSTSRFDEDQPSRLDALLYAKTVDGSRELICRRTVTELEDARWLEFDATVAVTRWIGDRHGDRHGDREEPLELEFFVNGEPVRRIVSSPFLNVMATTVGLRPNDRPKRSTPDEVMSLHKGRRTKCKGEGKKCCRHELTVMFKDLKGFEFIVYPKMFDAGYCKGRCPPRYNPAHHHALLQSLLWKEDKKKVPKPCCAPSKLDQLMIVYFDENDSTQLKVSYWKNIQVLECACS